jgi:acetoin:2,6-dichlorophenolindophenol oxidoreductase subunit alpha
MTAASASVSESAMEPGTIAHHAESVSDADLAQLMLIRHFEQNLLDLFGQGFLSGTTHTCLGQEQVPVAVSALLAPDDFVFSNHRGHGHYLARFDDPAGLLAEITGREGAVCNGVGGSQHIYRDNYLSTGVQGESVPVAVGVALSARRRQPASLALAYIGDGTWGEGGVYEALNAAVLLNAPVVVVVENNRIAQSTPSSASLAGSIEGRARAFGCRYLHCAHGDPGPLRDRVAPVIAQTRQGGGPVVIEVAVDRLGPHSKGDDTRDLAEIDALHRRDWYTRYREALGRRFADADAAARERVAAVARDVLGRPFAQWPAASQAVTRQPAFGLAHA